MLPLLVLLLAVSPNPAEVYKARMQEGMAALQQNNLPQAQHNFEEATRIGPNQAAAWLLLAQTYAREKTNKPALAAAKKAETFGGNDPQILQGLANFYATLVYDLPKATSFGMRYAEKNPGDTGAWGRLTAFCLETGQADKAIQAGKRGVQVDDSAGMHSLLGQAYLQQRDFKNAIPELSAAIRLNPYSEDANFQLSQAYLVQLDYTSAIAVLQKARQTFDKSAQIELALGVAYYGQRDFKAAADQFLRTIKLDPDVPQPYVFLDRMLDHVSDRLPEITKLFEQFESRNPKSPLGYLLHAKALIAQLPASGYPTEAATALKLLERSLAIEEKNPDAHYQSGLLLDRKKDYPAAAAHLERSIALKPDDSAVHVRLARVYDRLGRNDEAAKQRDIAEKLAEKAAGPVPDKPK